MIPLGVAAVLCALLIIGVITYYGDTIKSGYRPSTELYDALGRIECIEQNRKCPEYIQ